MMQMYLQKVISRKTYEKKFFVGILRVHHENSRIRIHMSEGGMDGSTPKCLGSGRLGCSIPRK
jgi:hypothetical protein